MMITTKGRNALKVMIDLANNEGGGFISLADIAQRQHESLKYLEASAKQLSAAGLVVSARGKSGGYIETSYTHNGNVREIYDGYAFRRNFYPKEGKDFEATYNKR